MNYIGNEFLLDNHYSQILYFGYAEKCPIFDYHNHLSIDDIYFDRKFDNLTQIWLEGDHFKWRIMRNCGIAERYISGHEAAKEKMFFYLQALHRSVGNPLIHWSYMELKKYFDYKDSLLPENLDYLWDYTNQLLKDITTKQIIKKTNVSHLHIVQDSCDNIEYFKDLRLDHMWDIDTNPIFRIDRIFNIDDTKFLSFIEDLSSSTSKSIESYSDYKNAIKIRAKKFNDYGCRFIDLAIDNFNIIFNRKYDLNKSFKKLLNCQFLSENEISNIKYDLFLFIAMECKLYDWTFQLHIGAIRNVNIKMYRKMGPDTGFDVINDFNYINILSQLFNTMNDIEILPKVIIFCLNVDKYMPILSLVQAFNEVNTVGKIQAGPAWWFNNNYYGIEKQIKELASLNVLGNFIGTLSDARSILNFIRHEYFRRILCNYIGNEVKYGRLPWDEKWLGNIIQDICYNNIANRYKV
jgi:glucuronate isomerase